MKRVILLIDDQPDDGLLLRVVTEKLRPPPEVVCVHDGIEAISYLLREGQYSDAQKFPSPNLILLDLKMPGMDGFEFLQWMQAHKELVGIPVVVFSGTLAPADRESALALGANGFLTKNPDPLELRAELVPLLDKWVPLG